MIYEKFPDKKHVWFSITAGELDKKRDKPQVYFEEESAEQGTVRIRGWAIAPKPVTVRIFDADKKPVAAEIQRTDRVDVNQLFEEAQDPGKTGFFSEITNVSGKCLYVVFYAGEKKTVHVVPLRKADILAKKLDKYVEKGIRYWKSQGAAALAEKVVTKVKNVRQGPPSYQKWIRHHLPDRNELEKQKKTSFGYRPKLSFVVPLYKTPEKYLRRLTESFQEQTYSNWELCFSDGSGAQSPLTELLKELTAKDNRIKYVSHEEPLQISENTNSAIEIATGDFIAFADHDDELTPNALFECVKAINEKPQTLVIYTDEDKMSMDGHKFFQPHFKPDYNPDLLCTVNYICHLFVVSRKVIEKVGGLRSEFDCAQDYDFVLRCVEAVKDEEICHIPKILYHWRCHEDSTAENPESKLYAFEAGRRAVQAHYERTGIHAEVFKGEYLGLYRTKFIRDHDPLISIIIPNKDHIDDLKRCMESIEQKSTYKNYEYIIVENNSTDSATFEYYKKLEDAVKATSGIVMTYEGKCIDPMYCRATAGMTRQGDFTHPYLQTVDCPGDVEAEGYMQMLSFSRDSFTAAINSIPAGESGSRTIEASQVPDTIQIVSRDEAGYVDDVQIGNAGYTGEEVQYALGLASSCFVLEPYEDGIRAVVKGIGHGYGLSQATANEKAKEGWKAEDILGYFYKNIAFISE